MNAILSPVPDARCAPGVSRLRLLGAVTLQWKGRPNAPWAYAKLPAMLAVLGASGPEPVPRDWLAALLWPEGDAASLRRALYDLRRQLRHGSGEAPLVGASRQAVWLDAAVPTDLEAVESAWRASLLGALDARQARDALARWDGEFARGLSVPGADDFELWLLQTRARVQARALGLAEALSEHELQRGDVDAALSAATLAVDRVPEAESARALLWRCQVAAGRRLLAVEDWRRHRAWLDGQGLRPSAALCQRAAKLELGAEPVVVSSGKDDDGLIEALKQAMRQGSDSAGLERLLTAVQARLADPLSSLGTATRVALLRRALMLRLMHAPWDEPMAALAAQAERLLCEPLTVADRLDLVQPLATWHGWMGRGLRGEVLVRTLAPQASDAALSLPARVRWEMTLALCHSCSTGDPERSIRAARRGLALLRGDRLPEAGPAFQMLVANAALNRDAPGDALVAERALARALSGPALQPYDIVNHHALSAQWQLAHGDAAAALAQAEQGERMALAVPFPLQGVSCALQVVAARMRLGEAAVLVEPLAAAAAKARRIGTQGYLMNAQFLGAALARRLGQDRQAALRLAEAQVIARACGAQRIRKIPAELLDEALRAA